MQQKLGMPKMMCEDKKKKGADNPAYQHGGKYSHFSKKFVNGYNEEKHKKLIQDNTDRNKAKPELFKTNIAYWLKQANGDCALANSLYKRFQTRDLSWFIEKYGETNGTIRHAAKTGKWMAALDAKSPEEKLRIARSKINRSDTPFISKAERALFDILKHEFPDLESQLPLRRSDHTVNTRMYLYDLALDMKIIEYNGDFWHANPSKFNETFISPHTGNTYAEIHARDADKLRVAHSHGYIVKVVWESDYKNDKEKVINECIAFLKQ